MARACAPLSRVSTESPFRNEREAALARVDALERELSHARRALEDARRELARKKKERLVRVLGRGMAAVAVALVILMGLAVLFGGCVAAFARETPGMRFR
jgi:hypothetical protein